ncbi:MULTISPECIES: hypothetical protein [unclassified Pedobacter]|uniref:hypothetical protein n=1 Tax=unclassified Pedobacter TaxID=2628915 RepID=UPI001DBAE2F7|nr:MULTISPECIES: hypothetical protein [unclassified Pedobacter]CAH0265793.1 hypothetical protein SRABI36_03593 [Pedobacter sp. Bi36]CAH0292156.1 hypothetical protein SRABI126_04087 [Pedobacter sp. Bi126]
MDKPNFQWYASPETMQETYNTMIIFGAEHFKSALVIQKLEALKQLIKDRKEGNVPDQVFHDYIGQFFFEKLTDAFKICLFFENYMKAVLLINGFLIHKLNKGKGYDSLANQQGKKPIKVHELHLLKAFDIDQAAGTIHHDGLSTQTLMMGTMLDKKNYSCVILLPESINNFLRKLVEKRNELHFITEWSFEMSESYLNQLDAANNFVDNILSTYSPR